LDEEMVGPKKYNTYICLNRTPYRILVSPGEGGAVL